MKKILISLFFGGIFALLTTVFPYTAIINEIAILTIIQDIFGISLVQSDATALFFSVPNALGMVVLWVFYFLLSYLVVMLYWQARKKKLL